MMNPYKIGDPELGGFKGVKLGDSNNNDLQPGEASDMYNYFATSKNLEKRGGHTRDNGTNLATGKGITGLFRYYNGSSNRTFAKCGTRVFDVAENGYSTYLLTTITEAGDEANQLSLWTLNGGGGGNTNNGVLYWKLTNTDTNRTVEIYKNSDGAAENLVASGTRSGDGSVTLNEANSSGLSGTVTVAYTVDDTDLVNNTLTYPTLLEATEIEFISWLGKYLFVDKLNLYYGTTGSAIPLTLLDENGTAISGTTPHGNSILVHKERLWMTRDPNFPTRVYFSQVDYYDRFFTDGGANVQSWVACERDDGQAITGFIRYNDKIFVTKREKHYWIIGEPTDTGAGTVGVSDAIPGGAYDQKTIVNCPDGFIRWFGLDGVWEYSDGTGLKHISEDIDDELEKILPENRTKCCAGWYKWFYILWYPYRENATYCNRGFIYDTKRGYWYPMKDWNISRFCRFEDDTLHAGWANDGYVVNLFDGTTDNEADVYCYFKSRLECQMPGWEQCLKSIQVMNLRDGQKVTIRWNGDEASPASGSFTDNFSIVGSYLNEFQLGDVNVSDDGDILVGKDELGSTSTSPFHRMNDQQRFRGLTFEIEESGPTAHSFDYLEVQSYPVRRVV